MSLSSSTTSLTYKLKRNIYYITEISQHQLRNIISTTYVTKTYLNGWFDHEIEAVIVCCGNQHFWIGIGIEILDNVVQ